MDGHTQNDICIGRADKFSGREPLLEPSEPFLLLFERVASLCDDVKIVTKIRCDQEEDGSKLPGPGCEVADCTPSAPSARMLRSSKTDWLYNTQ